MKPEYRRVKVIAPHCPVCKQELGGDNSWTFPWTCKCGIWEPIKYPFNGDYEIKPYETKTY